MKTLTRNPEAIQRYTEAFEEIVEKVKDGKMEIDGDGKLLLDSEKDLHYYTYRTPSGYGEWTLSCGIPNCEEALIFEGRRASFRNGSSFLKFFPRRTDGWTLVESSHSKRGPFEDKIDFYSRKAKQWINGRKPEHIQIEDISNTLLLMEIEEKHPDEFVGIVRPNGESLSTIIYDERDLDLDEMKKEIGILKEE